MGRLAVREAVAAYFANAGLNYVGKVHEARPEVIQEQDYESSLFSEAVASSSGSSAVLVVNIPTDNRVRRADTGRGAVNDSHIYKVAMEIYFANTSGVAEQAQKDYDSIVDAMTNLVRADATLDNPEVIWSAGEYEIGIEHEQGMPFTDADGLTVFIYGVVSFDTYQWIAGNV